MPHTDQNALPARPRATSDFPNPHGEAALILAESLLHGILARGALSLSETLAITETAVDVQIEVCAERSEQPDMAPPVRYLQAIDASLRIDDDPTDPREVEAEA